MSDFVALMDTAPEHVSASDVLGYFKAAAIRAEETNAPILCFYWRRSNATTLTYYRATPENDFDRADVFRQAIPLPTFSL